MKKLLEETRSLLLCCTLIDRSVQCEDMVKKIDQALKSLTDDKISTASFNHFTGDNMEREGFEQGAKWVMNTKL